MREEEPRLGITLQTHAMNILYTELVRLLGPSREVRPHQSTILMVGLYGNGKTTTTAKLAEWYRRRHGVRVAVIEADVHRPGAYNQLSQLLEESTVEVYGEPESTSAVDIVRNGLKEHARETFVEPMKNFIQAYNDEADGTMDTREFTIHSSNGKLVAWIYNPQSEPYLAKSETTTYIDDDTF